MLEVGIDSVEIIRIENSIKNERFLWRVFGELELEEFQKRGMRPESIAAAFACKEAFGKAIGTGISSFKLCEVQLLHNNKGKPIINLTGSAKEIADKMDIDLKASITHTATTATAIIIIYSKALFKNME